ncbi:hypothetical protein HYDPIDRAFT_34341 [Hydnomerulius pinastri MD-312]|uniref:Uncharacterized protein n=1 Tax=Hydnomerulius pinastri MD-312 TaxID=994086 RepID=A0A0C9W7B1_9AGAM|nr:hypothetical protein HYDPIDRAFT_34341 [Hydnomerulius pinastri MD-312]
MGNKLVEKDSRESERDDPGPRYEEVIGGAVDKLTAIRPAENSDGLDLLKTQYSSSSEVILFFPLLSVCSFIVTTFPQLRGVPSTPATDTPLTILSSFPNKTYLSIPRALLNIHTTARAIPTSLAKHAETDPGGSRIHRFALPRGTEQAVCLGLVLQIE